MLTLKNSALTEKGQIKPAVRNALISKIARERDLFASAVQVNDKGQFYITVKDCNGEEFFVNFEVTVSTKNIGDRAPKKSRAKASTNDTIDFE